jgi:hypothetical protein
MSTMSKPNGFDEYRDEIDAAEKRVAGEIEPGARALVVAIGVFVLIVAFILPHTGSVRGVDVLINSPSATEAGIRLPSQVFCWVALVFGIGFSMLALLTRRWVVAWVALAGTVLAAAIGLLAVWTRQTAAADEPGPGVGLILMWITLMVLAFHWARVVWTRTAVQLAAADARRRQAAEEQSRGLLDDLPPRPDDE